MFLHEVKFDHRRTCLPRASCSGHLSRCPQVCRGPGTWRCWAPVFWPCSQELRSSTCTTFLIWWVNLQLLPFALAVRLINVALNYFHAMLVKHRENPCVVTSQTIPEVPPKPGELKTELLGHKLREEAAALQQQQKVEWRLNLDLVTNHQLLFTRSGLKFWSAEHEV